MISIHNLDGLWEVVGNQFLNPGRLITDEDEFSGLTGQTSDAGGPQQSSEILSRRYIVVADFCPWCLITMHICNPLPAQ